MRSSTDFIPGADQAAFSTACRSGSLYAYKHGLRVTCLRIGNFGAFEPLR